MNNNEHEASNQKKRTPNDTTAHCPVGKTAYDKLMSAFVERRFCGATGKHERKGVKTLPEAISQQANHVIELVKKIFKQQRV